MPCLIWAVLVACLLLSAEAVGSQTEWDSVLLYPAAEGPGSGSCPIKAASAKAGQCEWRKPSQPETGSRPSRASEELTEVQHSGQRLEELQLDNVFTRELPADTFIADTPRQVSNQAGHGSIGWAANHAYSSHAGVQE
jgi:hypothetical protein